MERRAFRAVLVVSVCALASPLAAQESEADARGVNWPAFRGPGARGIAEGFPTPTNWDAERSENVMWQTPVPGLGHSSPIVWGDRVCVTSALSERDDQPLKVGLYGDIESVDDDSRHSWRVSCYNKRTGTLLWDQVAHEGIPTIKRHPKSTHANSTLATDGEHIVGFFGSEGLYAYGMSGEARWKKDLGVLDSGFYTAPAAQWGFASSPIIYQGMVIVQADVQQNSFVAAFDLDDGHEIWRTVRHDVPTFSTPTVHESAGRTQLIVNGYRHIGGYDVRTGRELWSLRGGGDIPVPTPVVAHDLIYITNAHGSIAPIYAIRTSAIGDISLADRERSNEHIAWSETRGGGYMQTPLVYGDYLYNCRNNGVLSVYEATTGRRLYQERLGAGRTGFTASPVAANGKVYFTSEEGDVFVVKAGPRFELLAENQMGEVCMATPAISEGVMFFRTQRHLVAIGAR